MNISTINLTIVFQWVCHGKMIMDFPGVFSNIFLELDPKTF